MVNLPVYVEAGPGDFHDAYLLKGGVTEPLRLAEEPPAVRLDPPLDPSIAAVARIAAALPDAATRATIARVSAAAKAVARGGRTFAAITEASLCDAAALDAAFARDGAALAAKP